MLIFYFYPLFKIFQQSFKPEGTWNVDGLIKLFTQTYYAKTLWFTFWQAAVSTLLTICFAVCCSYVLARFDFKGKKALTALIMVPFVLPTVVVAAAFEALIGESGIINVALMHLWGATTPPIHLSHSIWAILLAHVFYNTSVAVRIISGFWSQLASGMEEAARMLGASPVNVFFRITLPLLRPAIFSAALLVFLFCFSSFGVILILGGPRFATLEVEIYQQALHMFNLPMAATLSLVQILVTLILMGVYTHLQRKHSVSLMPTAAHIIRRRPQSPVEKLLAFTIGGGMILFFGLPLLALFFSSFWSAGEISLRYYRALFVNTSQSIFFIPPGSAIVNSLAIASATLVLATFLGLCAAIYLSGKTNRLIQILDPVFMLPLSTSAVTLGFGFILALDRPPLNLRTSFWIIPLAHSLVAFPFVVRSVLPTLASIPDSLKEAAQMLGAPPAVVFVKIVLPIAARAILVGAVFTFTISLGEFGATAFVARPQSATIPLAIYRFLGQPGALNYGQAMAMSTLLMITTGAGFLLLERSRGAVAGEL